jgi:peroxiredoxin (alkyl hydroperoxide reductase subunit C)
MGNLIGKKAPAFKAACVENGKIIGDFSLDHYLGSYVIFFFYPLDFTFVCPTELIAFQEKLDEFKKRGCQIVGCSVDSAYCHLAWLRTPRNEGGIQGVQYPLVSDLKKTVSSEYGVLSDEGVAFRGLFLIDQKGIVRHQLINDLPLGRSLDEALRMLDSLIYVEKNGEVCPANWNQGKEAMKPTHEAVSLYLGGK